jgi:hypothetical protein
VRRSRRKRTSLYKTPSRAILGVWTLCSQGFVPPEQDAVVYATTSAMLTSRKAEKAVALLNLGEALSFQFCCSMPGGFLNFEAWTELGASDKARV